MEQHILMTKLSMCAISATGAGAIVACMSCTSGHIKKNPPNVILILTDDQGYGDLSVHGNPVLKTPNLDMLHAQSIRFTDFHVSPMSAPTRGQLLTGRDALDNGATAVCMGRSMVREELPTMADVFKASGYTTVHFGKWHLGDSYPYRPQDRGFDETVHHGAWGIGSIADYFGNNYWDAVFRHNDDLQSYKGYCTDVWFSLAMDFLRTDRANGKPFFMYLATNCPHSPHLVNDSYSDAYNDKVTDPREAKFFGQIANIDENMGKLISLLEETGQDENTILIYLTDNGTSRGYMVFNAGMRGHKTEPYEGGHRVPLFIRWPAGVLGSPRDIGELTQCQDLLPTMIDMCGLKSPENPVFDGMSLVPLLKGRTKKFRDRMLVVEYENPYKPEENKAVMWEKWRLVKHDELYDLASDPGQETDVSGQNPKVVRAMRDFYDRWKEETLSDYNKPRYIHVGNSAQNPVILYSSDWTGSYADNSANLFSANTFGTWYLAVDTKGTYEITLSRWHPASGLALDAPLTDKVGNSRGAIPVRKARLKIGGCDEPVNVASGLAKVTFTLPLDTGAVDFQTWLIDKDGKEICSSFYASVELITSD
ncbi:MAG: arylsulfatase [Bacteroidales bacterium]|nr:arylsulfatase [Bacteroidales bacterium]